ncbi:ALX homeobox protein 1 [Nosema granulosis]|uniref:ALX homeobox protein 1 n=1 Tax=Nosema granulosis TaxID=83296 RepID=A0A9P6L0N3_9MICR|nr:ALX homeobox protein 1 [Nosema granulosis]
MYGRNMRYEYSDSFIRRIKPSSEQIEILNSYMLRCLYPDFDLINNAHMETCLTHKFIKTWFQNRRAAFKKRNRRYLSKRNTMCLLGKKHDLCKLYRTQNNNYIDDTDTDEAVFVIVDCTKEVISSYGRIGK